HDSVLHMAAEESFHASILELKVGKNRQKVVLRDLQRHPFKPTLIHIDFLRISDDQTVRISVPIHFANEEKSEAARMAGVVISHQITEVEVDALPKDLPEFLEIDLVDLKPGESVMLSQIKLPEGVSIPSLAVSADNDQQAVAAIFIRAGQGTGELAAEADAVAGEPTEVETVAEAEEGDADEAEDGADDDAEAKKGD
ncbi:MAG: 50S ribosomal protein L25, partial [Wenzhouxiangella sp.]